jgi:hypothetical protein
MCWLFHVGHIMSNGEIIDEWWIRRSRHSATEVPRRYLSGGAEKSSDSSVWIHGIQPRFQPNTSALPLRLPGRQHCARTAVQNNGLGKTLIQIPYKLLGYSPLWDLSSSGDIKITGHLACDAMQLGKLIEGFQRYLLLPFSGQATLAASNSELWSLFNAVTSGVRPYTGPTAMSESCSCLGGRIFNNADSM